MALLDSIQDTDFLAEALHIESAILDATLPHNMNDIHTQWANLEQQFQRALEDGKVSLLLESQVHRILERISLIFQNFSDVVCETLSLEPNYIEVVDNPCLLVNPPKLPLTTNNASPSKNFLTSLGHPLSPRTVSAADPTPLPEFIEHAYKYFVSNIHNPYPSREEKQAIVDLSNNSSVTLTSVSNWFTNARRRCGWADILKNRCKGNREEMINISKRVFSKENSGKPVDPHIVAEFMKMKKNVETMYDKKRRTSAWIEDIDQLVDTISLGKCKESDSKDRRSRKRRQEESYRLVQRTQQENNGVIYVSESSPPDNINESEESDTRSLSIVDGKHKSFREEKCFVSMRGSSPASSLSSFSSDFSLSRVPSLSWSDSGDDERPHKRSRPNADPSAFSSPVSSELLSPLDDSLDFNSLPPLFTLTSSCGQKRQYDVNFDTDATPTAKRICFDTTQISQSTSTTSPSPTHDISKPVSDFSSPFASLATSRRSSFTPVDFDSLLTLGAEEPRPVEITPPDTSIPLEVGVFDWSDPIHSLDLTEGTGMNINTTSNTENTLMDFSQLFQLIASTSLESEAAAHNMMTSPLLNKEDIDAGIEIPQSNSILPAAQSPYAIPRVQVDLASFDLTCLWPQTEIPLSETGDMNKGHTVNLTGFTSEPVSMQTLNDFSFDFLTQAPAQTSISASLSDNALNHSLKTSTLAPAWASPSVSSTAVTNEITPTLTTGVTSLSVDSNTKKDLTIDFTGHDLEMVEKALRREYRRRELEEKKAALEREREKLVDLERELEDD